MTEFIVLKGMMRNYLLKLKDGYLLVDTSWPGRYKRFLRKLKKYNLQVTDIKYLLLTHSHTDHSGFANDLLKDSRVKLIAHENAVPLLRKGVMESEAEPTNRFMRVMFRFVHKIVAATYPRITIEENRIITIKKDEDIPIPKEIGLNGKILITPGHTRDSISLILDDGKGFVGDLCTNNIWLFIGLGHKPPLNVGLEIVFRSWEKLVTNGVKEIYPAHGKPFPVEKLKIKSEN